MKTWIAIALLSTGCATTHSLPLTSLPLCPTERVAVASARRVVVGPFADARGPEFSRGRHLPVAGLFHHWQQLYYPEAAGAIRARLDHERFVATGSLDAALPVLLADTMQRMQLSNAITVDNHIEQADYYVTGRLTRSSLRSDTVPIAAWTIGLLGVPYGVVHFDLEYEVAVYDARMPQQPIFVRAYQSRDRRLKGHYYNHDAGYALLVEALGETLPQVVRDISQVISSERAAL